MRNSTWQLFKNGECSQFVGTLCQNLSAPSMSFKPCFTKKRCAARTGVPPRTTCVQHPGPPQWALHIPEEGCEHQEEEVVTSRQYSQINENSFSDQELEFLKNNLTHQRDGLNNSLKVQQSRLLNNRIVTQWEVKFMFLEQKIMRKRKEKTMQKPSAPFKASTIRKQRERL